MIANFLNSVANLSDHWAVVIGVSLVFFVVQAILSMKLYAQAWEQNRMLRQLFNEYREGLPGRPAAGEPLDDFPWLQWVAAAFPAGSDQPPRFNRETALHELDTRIASDWSYLLLQRMGVMAPLLGVVLTVIGFYWLNVDEAGEQSLQTILVSVTPLVAGVGAGAVLALLNQFLLQGVGGRLERLRMSARTWFDAVIWPNVAHAPNDAAKTVAAMETFATILVGAAHRHQESSEQIKASTSALSHAAARFEQIVSAVQGEIKDLPAALADIRTATAASAHSLEELIPAGARAVANLDVSVSAFRTTIDHEFAEAARIHHQASKSLENSATHIEHAAGALSARNEQLNQSTLDAAGALSQIDGSLAGAAAALAGAADRVQQAVNEQLAPSQSHLQDAAASFAQSADKLARFIEHGLQPATNDLASLHESLAGLQQTLQAIERFNESREEIDKLVVALGQASTIADALATLPDQLREVLDQATGGNERGRRTWIFNQPR